MKSWILAVGFLGACVVAAGACTVGSGDGDEGGGGTNSPTTSSSSSSSGGGQGGEGGTGGGGACNERADYEGCRTCCDDTIVLSQDAINNVVLGLIGSCGCATGGVCAAECDTADQASDFCAADGSVNASATNEACQLCVNKQLEEFTDSCVGSITDSCGDDATCTSWAMCVDSCSAL